MPPARTALRIGLALLAAGALLATPVLAVPGAALALIAIVLRAWVRLAGRGARVSRNGLPARVVEGEPFELHLAGRSGVLPLLGELNDPTLERPLALRSLRPHDGFDLRLEGVMQRRGRHRLAPPALELADPLGIASRRIAVGEAATLLVLPRVEPLRGPADSDQGPSVGRLSSGAGELTAGGLRDSAADPEVDGLRPYRAGTSASRIYWPALARNDELVERHLAPAAESGPLVVLDPFGSADEETLDRAVRAAASLTVHLARFGGCELLIGSERRRHSIDRDPASWMEAHAALALVGAGDGAPRLSQITPGAALAWVSARGAQGAPPSATRGYLITPAPLADRAVVFTVAGCHGHPLAAPRMSPPRPMAAA